MCFPGNAQDDQHFVAGMNMCVGARTNSLCDMTSGADMVGSKEAVHVRSSADQKEAGGAACERSDSQMPWPGDPHETSKKRSRYKCLGKQPHVLHSKEHQQEHLVHCLALQERTAMEHYDARLATIAVVIEWHKYFDHTTKPRNHRL
jgi:hypothetical protein